jgi:hypothetical protein
VASNETKECAFCPETANRSGEHLWSDWVNELSPGKKRFTIRSNSGKLKEWVSDKLDWKAKVVCERCNNTWMNDIENNHAKPSMSDLITGKAGIPIPQSRANSIALFAFKTAVVFDHLRRDHEPFFERSSRHEFRKSLTIPPNLGMWMAAFLPVGKGLAQTAYHDGALSEANPIHMYVCTYGVEHFVVQVVGCQQQGYSHIASAYNFPAVRFWPQVPDNLVWPPSSALRTADEFQSFADRWVDLEVEAEQKS